MDEESIKAAEVLGITALQVKDITEALKEIQKLTGIEVGILILNPVIPIKTMFF